jgi:hypothetical protein
LAPTVLPDKAVKQACYLRMPYFLPAKAEELLNKYKVR